MDTANLTSNGRLALEETLAIGPADVADDRAIARAAPATGLVALFASTLFLSAFLLFLVQPMVAKMVLPILGGAPMVWNACVVFFQLVLLAGYGYAYGASRLPNVRWHFLVHAGLLLIPFAVLPVLIDRGSAAPPEGNPVGWLLVLLAGTIGLPFFVLSTSASTLQHWFSRTHHPAARDPYFLYVASNVGSLVALIVYPVIVEPLLSLGEQSRLWTGGYAAFVVLAGGCALVAWRSPGPLESASATLPESVSDSETLTPVTARHRASWVVLAFLPSSLMLAVTSYVSTDIAAIPLMWIVPLALYLLTFAVGFSAQADRWRPIAARLVPLSVVPIVMVMSTTVRVPPPLMFPLHVIAFTAVALFCHTELARRRPGAAHLTEFYFWLAFGGMLGGLFNTLAAPLIFDRIVEYPLVLTVACLILPAGALPHGRRRVFDGIVPIAIGIATAGLLVALSAWDAGAPARLAAIALPALAAFTQRRRPLRFGLSVAAILLAGIWFGTPGQTELYASRTFYGVYRVERDSASRFHALAHGTTLHGMQALAPADRREPLTYYHRSGPIGQAFSGLPHIQTSQDIAIIGLGVGTLASYARPGQRWTFYEIDAAIEGIARTGAYFTYLDECGSRCRVVIGDARLSMARAREGPFDLIVLDAFSSDAIPVHLLTREALSLYVSRLAPGGVMAFHISNRHLALAPVVAGLAANHGLVAINGVDRREINWPAGKAPSHWVLMARTRAELGGLAEDPRWEPLVATASTPLWTDDFSNILGVLNFRER